MTVPIDEQMPVEIEDGKLPLAHVLMLSIEHRLGRVADAAEHSMRHIARAADALELIASKLDAVTETVETEGGQRYGTIRTHDAPPNWLGMIKDKSDA